MLSNIAYAKIKTIHETPCVKFLYFPQIAGVWFPLDPEENVNEQLTSILRINRICESVGRISHYQGTDNQLYYQVVFHPVTLPEVAI